MYLRKEDMIEDSLFKAEARVQDFVDYHHRSIDGVSTLSNKYFNK